MFGISDHRQGIWFSTALTVDEGLVAVGVGEVDPRPPLSHFHAPRPQQRGAPEKAGGRTVAYVLGVVPGGVAMDHGQWIVRLPVQLLASLVEADQRPRRVQGALVDVEDVLHPGEEGGVRFGSDAPFLL